jgi:hypothetical protein
MKISFNEISFFLQSTHWVKGRSILFYTLGKLLSIIDLELEKKWDGTLNSVLFMSQIRVMLT